MKGNTAGTPADHHGALPVGGRDGMKKYAWPHHPHEAGYRLMQSDWGGYGRLRSAALAQRGLTGSDLDRTFGFYGGTEDYLKGVECYRAVCLLHERIRCRENFLRS